ncbi:MAG: tetratricopeptide repeat protein [Phycisphaeraceae bacterium]|nr:tetratricopeptide repeat protein [Phycisphaeraceae bacterium]
MPISDPALRRKRLTRLLIVVAVVALLCGGLFALFQLNRTKPHVATEAELIAGAKEAHAGDAYDVVVDLLEKPTNRDTTLDSIQGDPELLRIYITARQDIPLFNDRHLTRIVEPLKQLIELDPEDRPTKLELLDTLLTLERNDEALSFATQLVEQYPGDALVLRELAEAQLQKNQFDKAMLTLQQAIDLEPLHVPTHAQVLDILTGNGEDIVPFAQRAQSIYDAHTQDPRGAMILAMALEAQGNNVQAVELMKKASAMDPPDPAVVPMLVQWLDRSGMHGHAYEYLQQHAANGIDTPASRLAIYRAFETGDYGLMLARLGESDPQEANTDLLAMWASALIQTGDDEGADQRLAELTARDNVIATTWGRLLELDREADTTPAQTINAIMTALESPDEFEQALARRHPYLMQRLGEAYLRASEPEIAFSAMMVATQNTQTWARPHRGLAQTLMELGQPEAALFHARRAMTRQEQTASQKWVVLAMAAAADPGDDGDVDRAMKEADQLPAGSPEAWDVLPATIDLLARAKRAEEATTRVSDALANQQPPTSKTLESLLQVAQRHGLGLETALTQAIESDFGTTPGLALIQAQAMAKNDGVDKGLQWIEEAAPEPTTKAWQLAIADYRFENSTDQPAAYLAKLASTYPDDLTLQLAALQANRPEEQPELFVTAVQRLRELAGDATIHWRMQQARVALADPDNEQALQDTVSALGEAEGYSPVHADIRLVLARCYLLLGDDLAAVERAQAARSIDPDNPYALLLHGRALHRLKRFDEASLDLTRVVGAPDLEPGMRFQACLLLSAQGQYAPVRRAIEQMWSAGQANSKALVLLARIYIREAEFAKADVICDALLQQPDAQALRFVATYSYQTGRADRAKQAIQAAQSDRISPADRMVILAEDAAQRGEIAEAVTHIKASVEEQPDNPQRWYDAVKLMLSVAQPIEAARLAKQGAAAVPNETGLSSLAKQEQLIQQIKADPALIPLAVSILTSEEYRGQSIAALQMTRDLGQSKDAAIALADLAKKYPDFKYLQELACDRLLRTGLDERAYPLAKSAMARFPDSAATARVATLAAFRLNDWQMLLSAASAWAQRNPQDRPNADLMRAAAMNQLDRYPATVSTLRPYVQLQEMIGPANELLFEYYTLAQVRNGDHPAAWQLLRPHIASSEQARTIALKRISEDLDSEQVIRDWHTVIAEHTGDSPRAQFALAKAPFLAGQRLDSEALVRLADKRLTQQILTDDENNVDMVYAKGQIAQRLGNLEAAEAAYRVVLNTVKDNPLVLNNLALVLSERGGSSAAEAEQLATRAVKLSDDDPNLIDTLATVLLRGEQYDRALETIERVINIDPSNPAWHMTKADILEATGETEQAEVIRQRYAPHLRQ